MLFDLRFLAFIPDSSLINSYEELASFRIQDHSDSILSDPMRFLLAGSLGPTVRNIYDVRGYYVHCIDCYNLRTLGKMHRFCHGHSNPQAGEAARADGYIYLVYLLGLKAESSE